MNDKVYLLWDESDDWGSNGKVRLHSVHKTRKSAEKVKSKQHMYGDFFRIQEKNLENR